MEHEEIHEQLARAMKAGGRTGEAAGAVMKVLQPHMAREEELVAPALALLRPAAEGRLTAEMASVLSRGWARSGPSSPGCSPSTRGSSRRSGT